MWPLFPILSRNRASLPRLIAANYSHMRITPDTARASFTLGSDGRVTTEGSAGPSSASSYAWLDSGNGALYDVRATLSSGTTPTGSAVGSWLQLSTSRSWVQTRTSTGERMCDLLIEIRPTGGGATVASATISLSAEVVSDNP